MKNITNEPIDFVIPWVNPNDPVWQKTKKQYSQKINVSEDGGSARYRDMDTLRYLFRSIEKNASWVNMIHFVTCNQIPNWLNIEHPQINIVNHEDFIPAEYLPTFNSRAIEFNYHRIPGISNNIVCFNDDMFVIKETTEELFFKNNLPCDAPCMCFIPVSSAHFLAPLINILLINKRFNKRKTISNHPLKWYNPKYGKSLIRNVSLIPSASFSGFINAHIPLSIKIETLKELWLYETEAVQSACEHRFRNNLDVNIWLASYWQYAKNEFVPRNPNIGCYIGLTDDMKENESALRKKVSSRTKLLCLNDEITSDKKFEDASALVKKYFEDLFPNKSAFEL